MSSNEQDHVMYRDMPTQVLLHLEVRTLLLHVETISSLLDMGELT